MGNVNKYKDKLEVGMVFKNYKAMCEHLEEPVKTGGRNRELQEIEWHEYFNWNSEGHKRIITEVIDKEYTKIVNKRNTVFKDSITTIVLNILYNSEHNPYIRTKNGLNTSIGITNSKFQEYYSNGVARARYAKENNHLFFSVDDFFTRTASNNKNRLTRVLDDLSKRDFVTYKNSYILVNKSKNGFDIYRQTTEEEETTVRDLRRKLLNEMKMESLSDVFKKGQQDIFYKKLNPIISEKLEVDWYYPVVSIAYNSKLVEDYLIENDAVLSDEQLSVEVRRLNDLTVDRIIKLAQKDKSKVKQHEDNAVFTNMLLGSPKEEKKAIDEFGKDIFKGLPDYTETTMDLVNLTVKLNDVKKKATDDDWTSEIFSLEIMNPLDDIEE